MQIVIDLPNRYYEMVKDFDTVNIGRCQYKGVQYQVINAIKNGKPLPAGHGRLGDLDALETEMINGINAGLLIDGYEEYQHINNMDDCVECVRYADAVIEADGGDGE